MRKEARPGRGPQWGACSGPAPERDGRWALLPPRGVRSPGGPRKGSALRPPRREGSVTLSRREVRCERTRSVPPPGLWRGLLCRRGSLPEERLAPGLRPAPRHLPLSAALLAVSRADLPLGSAGQSCGGTPGFAACRVGGVLAVVASACARLSAQARRLTGGRGVQGLSADSFSGPATSSVWLFCPCQVADSSGLFLMAKRVEMGL